MRNTRSDKKIRVAPSLNSDYHAKLEMLALACNRMTKTSLAELLIRRALDNEDLVESLQKELGPKINPFYVNTMRLNNNEFIHFRAHYNVQEILRKN